MSIVLWMVFGAIAGWIASMVVGKNNRIGLLGDIVIGIIGAFIGGLLSQMFGGPAVTGFNIMSLAIAILGSIVLLIVVQAITKSKNVTG